MPALIFVSAAAAAAAAGILHGLGRRAAGALHLHHLQSLLLSFCWAVRLGLLSHSEGCPKLVICKWENGSKLKDCQRQVRKFSGWMFGSTLGRSCRPEPML